MHFGEVDTTVLVDATAPLPLAATLVRGDLSISRGACLDGAPTTIEERDRLWATLRQRESELPENAGGEAEQVQKAIDMVQEATLNE
jgi:hypothetical protein